MRGRVARRAPLRWRFSARRSAAGDRLRQASLSGVTPKRVIVLGFDGMDYALTRQWMDAGRLPTSSVWRNRGSSRRSKPRFRRRAGGVVELITAWMRAACIFDFIHRDPQTVQTYLSTSRTEPAGACVWVPGSCRCPEARSSCCATGRLFWEELTRRGIETTIVRAPANFPPSGTATRE